MSEPKDIPAIFGKLSDSLDTLTKRLEAMQARDLSTEFARSEGRVGVDEKSTSFAEIDGYQITRAITDSVHNLEFASQIYVRQIRVVFNLLLVAGSYTVATAGGIPLLIEFFKDLRGGSMGSKPDATVTIYPKIRARQNSFVVATGVSTWEANIMYDETFDVNYRYVRISNLAGLNSAVATKQASALNTIYGAALQMASPVQVNFFGQ